MPTPPPYGVLLVTGGMSHQENYGPAFAADRRAQVVAVTDESSVGERRARLNREFAAALGVPYIADLDEALARTDVHIVSVCAEFERRARVAVRCAEAGKHVYLDKPMAATLAGARQVVEAVNRAGVKSQMFTQIGQPWAQLSRKVWDSGKLGAVRAIQIDLLFAKGHPGGAPLGRPRQEHYPPARFTFPDAKREVWTTALYSLAHLRWLTGREFESVWASTENYFFAEHYERDIEDFGALAVSIEGGVTASLTAGRIGWRSHPSYGPVAIRLFGERGSVTIDAHAPRFEIAAEQPCWEAPPKDPLDPMGFWKSTQERAGLQPKPGWHETPLLAPQRDQSRFLDAIEQDLRPQVTAEDGARVVEALLAAYQAAASGQSVRLPL